jgi:hypothetical protein
MKEFFQQLAIRLYNENNISDITWALCNSNMSFRNIFLDYCFDSAISQEIDNIEREFSEKSLRPDFLITDIDAKRYLLEVKKYDRNLHKEYKKLKNIEKLALIANYSVGKQDTYDYPRTWHGFIEHLTEAMRDNNGLNTQIINGYLDYLISVTGYFKGATMNLTNLCSLHGFLITIKGIVEKSLTEERFGLKEKEIKIKYDCCEVWSGIDIKFIKNRKYFHIWFGVTYHEKNGRIYLFIEFFADCSPNIKERLSNMDKGKYFIKPYPEGEGQIVEIKKSLLEKLLDDEQKSDSEQKYKEQKDDLREYFEEVFKNLIPE